jgi:hypothetical protein
MFFSMHVQAPGKSQLAYNSQAGERIIMNGSGIGSLASASPLTTGAVDFILEGLTARQPTPSNVLLLGAFQTSHLLSFFNTAMSPDTVLEQVGVLHNPKARLAVAVVHVLGAIGHWVSIQLHDDGRIDLFDSFETYGGLTVEIYCRATRVIAEALDVINLRWAGAAQLIRRFTLQCIQQSAESTDCGVFAACKKYP